MKSRVKRLLVLQSLAHSVTLWRAAMSLLRQRRSSYLSFFLENDGSRKPRFFFFFSGVASVAVGDAADTWTTVYSKSLITHQFSSVQSLQQFSEEKSVKDEHEKRSQNWLQLMDGQRRWGRSEFQTTGAAMKKLRLPSLVVLVRGMNRSPRSVISYQLCGSKWRLLCQPYSSSDQECITKVCKNRWMDGWLVFNGILSTQVAAISCLKKFKLC